MALSSMTFSRRAGSLRSIAFGVAICSISLAGCGSGGQFPVAKAGGEFVVDGKPLTVGRVMLSPIASGESATKAGRPAFGDLNADGAFILTTYDDGDGAVVGKHRVTWINTARKTDAGKAVGVERLAYPSPVEIEADKANHVRLEISGADFRKFGKALD